MDMVVIPELAKSRHIVRGNAASSGIHFREIPAFAGMTMLETAYGL